MTERLGPNATESEETRVTDAEALQARIREHEEARGALLADYEQACNLLEEVIDASISAAAGEDAKWPDLSDRIQRFLAIAAAALEAAAALRQPREGAESENRESARESTEPGAYKEIERLRSQVRCARAWFAQLADPANYPKNQDPAAYARAFAAQVMGDMWVSAESSVEPTNSTTEAALADALNTKAWLRERLDEAEQTALTYAHQAREAEAALAESRGEVERLTKALAPFAALAKRINQIECRDGEPSDGLHAGWVQANQKLTLGDFRRAAAAFGGSP